MFTIKLIQVGENKVEKTQYILGKNILVKRHIRNGMGSKETPEPFGDFIKRSVQTQEPYFFNHGNEELDQFITTVEYFNESGDWKEIVMYSGVNGYIMDGGKTVDRIIV